MTRQIGQTLAARSFAVAAWCALAGCAGSAGTRPGAASPPSAEPAAFPEAPASKANAPSEATAAPAAAGASTRFEQAAPAASPPAPPLPSTPAPADASRDQPRARSGGAPGVTGSGALERAEREIASGDCATACRALGSMERAVAFLCMQAQSDGDANRCSDAKARLVTSRRHVRTSCGGCAGGPSVDPDAPIPSTR